MEFIPYSSRVRGCGQHLSFYFCFQLTFPEFMANHVRQSQQTFGNDQAFGDKVMATWDVKMEYTW